MQPDQSLPNDPRRESDDPMNEQQVERLEQRLKTVQPRSPRLDMKALDRIYAEREQRPVPVAPQVNDKSVWYVAPGSVIAVSWACGALVGALVTFVLVGRGVMETPTLAEQSVEEEGQTGENDHAVQVTGQQAEIPTQFDIGRQSRTSLVAMNLIDPYSRMASRGGQDSPVLRVGMYTNRSFLGSRFQTRSASEDDWPRSRRPNSELKPRPLDSEERPASTRERLMQDLLSDERNSVL